MEYVTGKFVATLLSISMVILLASNSQAALDCTTCHGTAAAEAHPEDTPPGSPPTYRNITTGAIKGNHGTHVKSSLTGVVCTRCHGAAAASYQTNHAKLKNYSIQISAGVNYNKGAGVVTAFPQTANPTLGTCSTVNCHFETITPTWGSDPLGLADLTNCNLCHSSTPATNAHNKHFATYGATLTTCSKCHSDHTIEAGPFQHATSAGRPITVGSGYSGSNNKYLPSETGRVVGSCSTASCHSPYSSAGTTPLWSDSNVGCVACHNGSYPFLANGAPNTGSHQSHMDTSNMTCGNCHSGAVKDASGGSSHGDGFVNVTNDYTMTLRAKHIPGTPGNATDYGTCSSASCHASPYDITNLVSPVWGAAIGCAACHTAEGAFAANGAPASGSHEKHLNVSGVVCDRCHSGAIKDVSGGARHPNGYVNVGNGYLPFSSVTKHSFNGSFSGYCSNASCHNDGNGSVTNSPVWGSTSGDCTACHGGDVSSATPMNTNKHRKHMNNYSTLGLNNQLKCASCHAKTVSLADNRTVSGVASHNNTLKDYSGANAGRMQTLYGQTTCASNYCHSSGQAVPVFKNMTGSKRWSGAATLNCNGCHGSQDSAAWSTTMGAPNYRNNSTADANSHQKHVAPISATTGCSRCHSTTVDPLTGDKLKDNSASHLNRIRNVSFAVYGAYSSNTKSCSVTYCHSNVQAPGGLGIATVFGKPVWGSNNGTMNCASCHNDMSTLPETPEALTYGSHRRHAVFNNTTGGTSGAGYSCSVCHGSAYSPTNVSQTTHADSNINISFTDRGTGTRYSQYTTVNSNNAAGGGYGTCSTSKCHGRAIRDWGISTTKPTCEKCHGSQRTAKDSNEFFDTSISSEAFAGRHVRHLSTTFTDKMNCTMCHIVPESVHSFGHMTSLPARVVFSGFASRSSLQTGFKMTPTYDAGTKTCNTTYCHAGVKTYALGSASAPVWDFSKNPTNCSGCHASPPPDPHPPSTANNCKACHDHVNATGTGFLNNAKHINGIVETTADDCLTCHKTCTQAEQDAGSCYSRPLDGAHNMHTDVDVFLAGKKLSTGDYIDPSWIFNISYVKGFPRFACGFCHPMESSSHKNAQYDLDFDPSHSQLGTVKTKSKPDGATPDGWVNTWLKSYTSKTNVVCGNVYCHSNGYISPATNTYTYRETPNWYFAEQNGGTSPWNGLDRCVQCHGNSPNTDSVNQPGSDAHGRHIIANHYKDVFAGYSGKVAISAVSGNRVHGSSTSGTTFNCNLCHYATVKDSWNDKSASCSGCHNGNPKGTLAIYSSSNTHVNGIVNVDFREPFNVLSKAQLRNSLGTVQTLYTSWTRVKGYKTYSSSHDRSRQKPSYVNGSCNTVACHNATSMEWRTKGPLECAACHTALPN